MSRHAGPLETTQRCWTPAQPMKLKQKAADGGLRVFAATRSFLNLNRWDLAAEERQVRDTPPLGPGLSVDSS